ncbi:unnamed protein product [Cylindrotheca closterium]|uniref:Uncharacterized protein n=1 Tax=Cylindrotheca closterium TaxID=2856 RepID=A0AAD2JNY7_9STRA|nr:unnamed protein product [Cylindrotheca closterium]
MAVVSKKIEQILGTLGLMYFLGIVYLARSYDSSGLSTSSSSKPEVATNSEIPPPAANRGLQLRVNSATTMQSNGRNKLFAPDNEPWEKRCALLFFGLPRSYKDMVLPSLEQFVLNYNAKYNCDVFVHYFHQRKEAAGRYNDGGELDPTEVLRLERAVHAMYQRTHPLRKQPPTQNIFKERKSPPIVKFIHDTNKTFYRKRGEILKHYHKTKDKEGNPLFFPWKNKTWKKSSLDNVVRQWHSIQAVFELMDEYSRTNHVNYTRVGMLRNDVMFLAPVDILRLDNGTMDTDNNQMVVCPFGRYPVCDRMVYGPYLGVKIWATYRFQLIEERVKSNLDPGYGMHSERFLNDSIIPYVEENFGYHKHINYDICFVRTRPDNVALVDDCIIKGSSRGWDEINRTEAIEKVLGFKCEETEVDGIASNMFYLYC